MKLSTLKKAQPDGVIRLANWLRLNTKDMSYRQILKLVKWRLNRNEVNRF